MFEVIAAIFLIVVYCLIKLSSIRNNTTVFGSPWVPLEPHVVKRVMELLKIKPGDIFYDLGSGDGRLVIAAAALGARAYGVEIDRYRVWYSRFCIFLFGLNRRATIIQGNVLDVDYSSATAIQIYLLQPIVDKLYYKLTRELKPGTRIVCSAFNLSKLKPVTIDPTGPIYGPLYLYHLKPSKKSV
jgi:predicted RNA methylase